MPIERLLTLPLLQLGSLVAESWTAFRGRSPYAEVPPLDPSLRLVGEALLDRSFTLAMNVLTGVPRPELVRQMASEAEAMRDFLAARGWLEDPRGYHVDPPPLRRYRMVERSTWLRDGLTRYAHLEFDSLYEPHAGAPGRDRWLAYPNNQRAHAWVLEHPGAPRPWLVCVHGFGMGRPLVDLSAFEVHRLHHELGLNLVIPSLPLHGPRSSGRISGGDVLRPDYLTMVNLFGQAAWDIRRVISWVRRRGGERVGLYGLSLGGYSVSLTAGLEPDLACVIAGIPAVDFANLARDNEPWVMQRFYEDQMTVDWQVLRSITYPVSPLAFECRVPHEGRFITAGIADRVVRPDQARALWRHWDRPEIHWFSGGHVIGQMKRDVSSFVAGAVRKSGLAPRH